MKILFVTYYFQPYKTVASVRTGKMAKLLFEMGHDIKVISAKNKNTKEELEIDIPKTSLYQTNWIDIDSYVLKYFGNKNKSNVGDMLHGFGKISLKSKLIKFLFNIYNFFIYTPDKHIGWYFPALKEATSIIKDWKPDIIYASGSPYTSLMIASTISKKYNIPFVAELRDLWSDNHYRRQYLLGRFLEYKTLNQASAIVSVSKPLVKVLKNKYGNKCYEIRNGYDDEDFDDNVSIIQREKIIITYAGMLYAGKRDPSILFQAISKDEYLKKNVKCLFYGDSLDWIKNMAVDMDIEDNVEVHKSIDRDKVLAIQKESDILLLLTWNNEKEKGVFTGKLFEYIGSAKPILSIGAVDDVASIAIKENGFGIASNQISEIIEFIKNVKNKDYLEELDVNYRKNRNLFNRKYQADKLVDIFKIVCERDN